MSIDTCIKEWILDKLEEYEGEIDSDLAYNLWERENIDGSITCSTYEAQKWIREYFSDLGDYVEEYEQEFGQWPINPFQAPEVFMVIMVIFITDKILYQYDVETKEELIKAIKEDLN